MTEEDEEFNRIERESMMRMKAVEAVVTRGGSRATVEMAREAGLRDCTCDGTKGCLERLVELVRAEERNSWPAEMEAMERQVNILTDALAQARADEREEIKQAVEKELLNTSALMSMPQKSSAAWNILMAIRARSNT